MVGIVDGAMVADGQKMVARRCSKLERKLRRGLRVKDGGTVEIAADVTGTVTVDAVMAGSGSRRVSLWPLRFRFRMRVLRPVRAMRWVKVLRVRMVRAGGVDAGVGVVVVAAAMSCRKAHRRRAMDLRLP